MLTYLMLLKDRYMSEKAQGITEYALLLAFVVVLAALALSGNFGNEINNVFTSVGSKISDQANKSAF